MDTTNVEIDVNFCKGCGGFIEWFKDGVLCSNPPQYAGRCTDCKDRVSEFCYKVDGDAAGKELHDQMRMKFEERKCQK